MHRRFWNDFILRKWTNKVFVAMCFDKSEIKERYYKIIKPAIKASGLTPYILKNMAKGNFICEKIAESIIECKILLFDISLVKDQRFRNDNVMFELGLATTWRLPEEVIVIKGDKKKLPFNINQIEVNEYNDNNHKQAIAYIKKLIELRIKAIKHTKDAKLIRAREGLDIQTHNLLMKSKGREFSLPQPTPIEYRLSAQLLLRLGLVEMKTDIKGWGYFPTDLGREVIRSYGIKVGKVDFKAKYKTLHFD